MRLPRYATAMAAVISLCGVLLSCAAARDVVTDRIIRPPSVRIVSAEITDLSFSGARLLFDVEITNSNPIGIMLDGFEYELFIENETFLSGRQDGRVEIAAGGTSVIPLPLAFEYADVYRTFENMVSNDGVSYGLVLRFFFDLPVLGMVEVPARIDGEVPLLKIPVIAPRSLRVARVGLSSADILLEITVDNPNSFSFEIPAFRYDLLVNGTRWAEGHGEDLAVGEKKITVLSIPLTVRYREVSQSLNLLLSTGKEASCVLKGTVDIKTPLPLLGDVSLPFEVEADIPLTR